MGYCKMEITLLTQTRPQPPWNERAGVSVEPLRLQRLPRADGSETL